MVAEQVAMEGMGRVDETAEVREEDLEEAEMVGAGQEEDSERDRHESKTREMHRSSTSLHADMFSTSSTDLSAGHHSCPVTSELPFL